MKLVTYGDDPSKIRWLREPYTNIGLGKQYRDMFSKLEALSECVFDDQEIVCFVDGYDVMQFGELDELEKKFLSFKADLVFGAETFCWPSPWMYTLFPKVDTKYKYPNSGMYIGRWWAIKKFLEWDTYRLAYDDQGYAHDFFLRQSDIKCVLDYNCLMFQNCVFVPLTDFEYYKDRVVNHVKGTQPCFFHFSGKSYTTVDDKNIMELIDQKIPFKEMLQKLTHLIVGQ